MLEKISHMVLLKDFYGPLITQKQQDILNLQYENDWSLSEIADHIQTSRRNGNPGGHVQNDANILQRRQGKIAEQH